MTTTAIKTQITKHIKASMNSEKPRLSGWYVGITNSLNRRKAEHKIQALGIKFWKTFDAESMKNANEVEAYFSNKGTANRPSPNGAIKSSKFVYVFKKPISKNTGLNAPITDEDFINLLFK